MTMVDTAYQANLFRSIYSDLLIFGNEICSRGMLTIEIQDYVVEFPPYMRWSNFEARNFKFDYFKHEFLWYLNGNTYDLSICKYAKIWKDCVDDAGRINSNYGYHWFKKPPIPFNFVVEQLKEDKFSRRAVMPIVAHDHLYIDNPDIPCTGYIGFRIREDRLYVTVHMRSQDAIFGLGNDLPSFSILQEMVCCMLKNAYPDLKMGPLTLHVDSFHFYLKYTDMVKAIAEPGSIYIGAVVPRIWGSSEVEYMLNMREKSIFNGFQFTNWLRGVDYHDGR